MDFSTINISQFFVMKRSCTFSAASLLHRYKASDKVRGVFFWALPTYSAVSIQESSSKMAQNKGIFRDEGGSSSSQLSCLTVHSVVSKAEVNFPIFTLSAVHSLKAWRFSVQALEYICVLSNELPKLFSCLCPHTFSAMNIPSIFV